MDKSMRTRGLTPKEAGEVYGKFTPAPLGKIRVRMEGGKMRTLRRNRAERRKLIRDAQSNLR